MQHAFTRHDILLDGIESPRSPVLLGHEGGRRGDHDTCKASGCAEKGSPTSSNEGSNGSCRSDVELSPTCIWDEESECSVGVDADIFNWTSISGNLQQVWVDRRRLLGFRVAVVLVHILVHIHFLVFSLHQETIWKWPPLTVWLANIVSTTLPLTFWIVFTFLRVDASLATQQASFFFLYSWFAQVLYACVLVHGGFWWDVFGLTDPGRVWNALWAVWWRVSMAERAFKVSGAASCIVIIGSIYTAVPVMRIVLHILGLPRNYGYILPVGRRVFLIFSFSLVAVVVWHRFSVIIHAASHKAIFFQGKKFLMAEAVWARRTLMRVRRALVLLCTAAAGAQLIDFVEVANYVKHNGANSWSTWFVIFAVPSNLYLVVDFFILLEVVGFFRAGQAESDTPSRPDTLNCESDQPSCPDATARNNLWLATVSSLAERHVEAGELLDFFCKLPDAMPWYDPLVHTTNDVVRAAIIPLSLRRDRGEAFASTLGHEALQGLERYPQRMVTHDWRNLFLHLVSAVLADACGKEEYRNIAESLCSLHGQAIVRMQLERSGGIRLRYWICAFCVNQHAGICGGFSPPPPKGTLEHARWEANCCDSALGTRHPVCTCITPKHFLDSPDLCEMNKFDDMMALLHNVVPDFTQVIAIDTGFELFTRVWCVAELVKAHQTSMPQVVSLPSRQALDANVGDLGLYVKLATLSVADCSATCIEDKDVILSKIKDIPEFDAQLQAVIFGSSGLLGRSLIGFDMIYTAARAALRVNIASAQALSRTTAKDLESCVAE